MVLMNAKDGKKMCYFAVN